MIKYKWLRTSLLLILAFALVLGGCGMAQDEADPEEGEEANQGADQNEEDQEQEARPGEGTTITFGMTPWTTTIPPTYVAKAILEDMGYTVDLQDADVGVVFTGLARGDIDVFMDAWLPDMHRNYMEEYGDRLHDTATSYPDGELGWVVPTYMEDIQSIEDIQGNETLFEGSMYGIEEGAGMTITSREMIETYGLDLEYVASSEPGMLSQAKRLIDQEQPVLFLGWRPHPMFVNFDLKVLEDPQDFFETSEVHVITNQEFQNRAPEAFAFLENWRIPIEDVEEMIVEIEGGRSEEEVAREWIENNQDKVNEMKNGANDNESA